MKRTQQVALLPLGMAIAAILSAHTANAQAQGAAAQAPLREEVVVTARFREENL